MENEFEFRFNILLEVNSLFYNEKTRFPQGVI